MCTMRRSKEFTHFHVTKKSVNFYFKMIRMKILSKTAVIKKIEDQGWNTKINIQYSIV